MAGSVENRIGKALDKEDILVIYCLLPHNVVTLPSW